MIKCKECGMEISEGLEKCNFCGCPVEKEKHKKRIGIIIGIIIVVLAIGSFILNSTLQNAKPIPFSGANWGATQEEIIKMCGVADDEYDNEFYGHILAYNDVKNENYVGIAKYCFENGELTRVLYEIEKYDESIVRYFEEKYRDKYQEPSYSDEYGNKRWDEKNASYGITASPLYGGYVQLLYLSPALRQEG